MASTNRLRDESVFWKIFYDTEDELKGDSVRIKALVRSKVLKRFADQYKVPVGAINPNDNGSIYSSVALIMKLLIPSSEQAKQDLHRELERGKLAFNCAVQIARGKIRSRKEYISSSATVIKKTAIELVALLDSVCKLGLRHGYSNEDIAEALELAKEGFDERV